MLVATPVGREPMMIQFLTVLLSAPLAPVVEFEDKRITAVMSVVLVAT